MSQTATANATICNRLGLHARPAMAFVDTAASFKSDITVRREDASDSDAVDGKSIMQVMMLAATKGTVLVINAEGEDAEQAAKALADLVSSGFGEA